MPDASTTLPLTDSTANGPAGRMGCESKVTLASVMGSSMHNEHVQSPNRRDFEPGTYRRWHVMTTMVEHKGKKVPGRYVVPLRLKQHPTVVAVPGMVDPAHFARLVGCSADGARLQVQVPKWVKHNGKVAIERDEGPTIDDSMHRLFKNLFFRLREWIDVSEPGVPHPILGAVLVTVAPRLVMRPRGPVFENESV